MIYIVDDDEDIRDSLAMLVQSAGFRAKVFASGEDILAYAGRLAQGCLLLDVCLPGQDGVQVLRALQQQGVTLPVIFMSGHPGVVADVRRGVPGEIAVLQKPMRDAALFAAIRMALRRGGGGGGKSDGGDGGSDGRSDSGSDGGVGRRYAVSTTERCGFPPDHSKPYDSIHEQPSARQGGGPASSGVNRSPEEGKDHD
jgi:DNA-binding response OmpR family regulator